MAISIGKKDAGVTEVIGFILILGMVLAAGMIWLTIAVPIQEEREEFAHANSIQMEYSEFKTDVDNIWMSKNPGIIFQQVFTLSPNGRNTDVTMMPDFFNSRASGTLSLEKSNTQIWVGNDKFEELWQLHYRSSNMYAKNIEVLYIAGAIFVKFGDDIWFPAVNPSMSPSVIVVPNVAKDSRINQVISGEDTAVIEYRLNSTDFTKPVSGVTLTIIADENMETAWKLMLIETMNKKDNEVGLNHNVVSTNLNSGNLVLVKPEYLIGVR